MTAIRMPLALALAAMPFLGGCNGAIVGNLFVLMVTLGIFFGTLGLGRSTSRTSTRSADQSASGTDQSGRT